jgi:hypothetical protein
LTGQAAIAGRVGRRQKGRPAPKERKELGYAESGQNQAELPADAIARPFAFHSNLPCDMQIATAKPLP